MKFRIKSIDLRNTEEDLKERHRRGQQKFGEIFLKDAQPFVPLEFGPLRGSSLVENGGKQVSWEIYSDRGFPYGVQQFYTQYSNYTTPGTGPRWDEQAKANHYQSWVQQIKGVM